MLLKYRTAEVGEYVKRRLRGTGLPRHWIGYDTGVGLELIVWHPDTGEVRRFKDSVEFSNVWLEVREWE